MKWSVGVMPWWIDEINNENSEVILKESISIRHYISDCKKILAE